MALAGSLVLNLGINVAKFSADAEKAKSISKSLGSSVKSALSQVGFNIDVLTLWTNLKGAVGDVFTSLDGVGKTADRLGITTEAMISLNRAAGDAGASTEDINRGLTKLQRTLVDAANAGGPAKAALDQLGLSANELIGLTLDQALIKISDRMAEIPNEAKRGAIAFDLFGKSGVNLGTLLGSGGENIRAVMKDTKELGLLVGRFDIAQIEAANDAWDRMNQSIKGVATSVAIELAPSIKQFSDWVTGINTASTSISSTGLVVHGLIDGVTALFGAIGQVVHGVVAGFGAVTTLFLGMIELIARGIDSTLGAALNAAGINIGKLGDTIEPLRVSAAEFTKVEVGKALDFGEGFGGKDGGAPAKATRETNVLGTAVDALKSKLSQASLGFRELYKEAEHAAEVEKRNQKALADTMAEWRRAAQDVKDSLRSPAEEFAATITNLREMEAEGLIDPETFGRAVREAKGKLQDAVGVGASTTASAVRAGSQEAFAAQARSQQQQAKPLNDLLKESKRQTDYLKEIADKDVGELAMAGF